MRLYLVQHALAFTKEENPERNITDDGISQTQKMADFFAGLNTEIFIIWHSGKKRAEQTAAIFATRLGIPNRMMVHSSLGPLDHCGPVFDVLKDTHHNTLIVGHLPYLSRLLSSLVSCGEDKKILNFCNSGIACLERTEESWELLWSVTPEILHPYLM